MHSSRIASSARKSFSLTMLIVFAGALSLTGCRQPAENIGEHGGSEVRNSPDCLPDITLVDQHDRDVSLASLKG